MLLFFWKEAGSGDVTVTPGAGEVLINGNAPSPHREYLRPAGASEVLVNGNQPTLYVERTVSAGSSEVLINGGNPGIVREGTFATGAAEVLIEGNRITVVVPDLTVRADTHGSGLYDRQLELQEEDDLILQVIQSFLKHAA